MATLNVVTGPPAAGKTTFVTEHAQPGDIRIDLDHIANTLAGANIDNHDHAPHILAVAKAARQAAIDAATKQDATVWLIHTNPKPAQRAEYEHLGATIHVIDPGKQVVMKRCKTMRTKGAAIAAAKWYDGQAPAKTTTQRGYGWQQQQQRQRLMRQLKDGTPCWWCGKPMYRNKDRNHDGLPLAADHEDANGARDGKRATRLLHFTCNSSRKDGSNDANRPALTKHVPQAVSGDSGTSSGFTW